MVYSLWIQVLHFFRKIYSQVFYSFCCYCKWNHFNFNFRLFIASEKKTYFWLLILYPAILLNSFILTVFVDSLWFSTYKIILFVNRDVITPSFSIWVCFLSFSCLIALPSSTVLSIIRHLVLFLISEGSIWSFELSILTVGFW